MKYYWYGTVFGEEVDIKYNLSVCEYLYRTNFRDGWGGGVCFGSVILGVPESRFAIVCYRADPFSNPSFFRSTYIIVLGSVGKL